MEKDAARLLGENVLAGATVASKGHTSRVATAGVGGAIGGLVAGAISAGRKPPTTPGGHTGLMFLAASPSKLAIFAVKQGLMNVSIDRLLVEHPVEQVRAIEIKTAIVPKVNIVLTDGTNYALECGLFFLGKVKKVKAALAK